jgi:hypothetical protein
MFDVDHALRTPALSLARLAALIARAHPVDRSLPARLDAARRQLVSAGRGSAAESVAYDAILHLATELDTYLREYVQGRLYRVIEHACQDAGPIDLLVLARMLYVVRRFERAPGLDRLQAIGEQITEAAQRGDTRTARSTASALTEWAGLDAPVDPLLDEAVRRAKGIAARYTLVPQADGRLAKVAVASMGVAIPQWRGRGRRR